MRTYLPTLLIILLYSTTLFGQVERPQIWDFGAVSFDRTRFENMLTSGEINSWMPTAVPGATNVYISDFLG